MSGGHTELQLVEGLGSYTCLCRTRDDAAGEAFDKSANLLNLGYPGGAKLAEAADTAGPTKLYTLPRVAREMSDFSFSGLKTAVLMLVRKCAQELSSNPAALGALSWAIQDAIVDTLVHKTRREVLGRALPLVVCGGVSANQELRRRLSAELPRVVFPPMQHCVDNGAMIAYVAGRYMRAGVRAPRPDIFSRWPVESLQDFYGVHNEAR